jgi:hypothetical protein
MAENNSDCGCNDSMRKIRQYLMIFAVPVVGLLITITGFYFTTKNTLEAHEKEIQVNSTAIHSIEKEMFTKQDMKEFKEELRETLKEIKADIKDIKRRK